MVCRICCMIRVLALTSCIELCSVYLFIKNVIEQGSVRLFLTKRKFTSTKVRLHCNCAIFEFLPPPFQLRHHRIVLSMQTRGSQQRLVLQRLLHLLVLRGRTHPLRLLRSLIFQMEFLFKNNQDIILVFTFPVSGTWTVDFMTCMT